MKTWEIIWMMAGWGLVLFGALACVLAIMENRKGVCKLTIDMKTPGQKRYFEWLSGGSKEGELLEAAVLDTGFTDFYRLKVRNNTVISREKIDTVSFRLESKDFPPLVKLVRQNGKVVNVDA